MKTERTDELYKVLLTKDKSFEEYLLHPDTKRHCCPYLRFTVPMLPEKVMCCTR